MTERQLDNQVNAKRELVLSQEQIGDQALAEALKVNTTLTELRLSYCQIGEAGARAIAEALRVTTTLTLLRLNVNGIGSAGVRTIAEALKVNKTVTVLNLSENQIGDIGAQVIADALKVNTTLKYLVLSANQIGAAGAHAIAELLKVNTQMGWLSLHRNRIGDAGAQTIAEALKVNPPLTYLDLRENQIGDIGAQEIAEGIKVNTRLGFLDLQLNCIGNAGLQAFDEARKDNRASTDVGIDRQVHPRLFSLLPRRLATAEDLQNVFHLLASGQELKDQPTSLPALPAELAELIMDKAHYWQGVQHTKRSRFGDDSPEHILKVTLPQGVNGNSIRVKSIQVFRDMGNRFDSNGSSRFDLIVLDEQRAVQYECSVKPTLADSSLELVTILPASHPVIRQMRAGWQVQVRASKSSRDVVFESLYVGYV
ncbi:hypothetical protein CAOG_07665 [Capsaspora owczarzaki ATCC 30864]|uniref:NOD3 protein n=1 Tax=Capsaspora owczarzaki (strain ATCC 30864) TaxID=595528 RepID=A0A0D2X556_CAPO3|nr:hypothetical protein CAOG_07665 [Capsaspora owczarzaki ATCC 30864]KJE97224.1 hypothetical protein CAOG_007665 [Capsaspora owczarzaki ATCC 30864]|eukprot:XP_004343539.1 hypothetical protein CAOG_07665 [Capsaspora owczarzaki ATCC 30864]